MQTKKKKKKKKKKKEAPTETPSTPVGDSVDLVLNAKLSPERRCRTQNSQEAEEEGVFTDR